MHLNDTPNNPMSYACEKSYSPMNKSELECKKTYKKGQKSDGADYMI